MLMKIRQIIILVPGKNDELELDLNQCQAHEDRACSSSPEEILQTVRIPTNHRGRIQSGGPRCSEQSGNQETSTQILIEDEFCEGGGICIHTVFMDNLPNGVINKRYLSIFMYLIYFVSVNHPNFKLSGIKSKVNLDLK